MPSTYRIAMLLFVGGCGAFSVPVEPQMSTPLRPLWSTSDIRGHLEFLNGSAVRGRADGTVGYGVAAQYVARLLGEYGLQPVQGRDFRVLHPVSRNVITGARLRVTGIDSISFVAGLDFLPDPKSSSIRGLYGEVARTPKDAAQGAAVVLSAEAGMAEIVEAREAGATLIIVERSPRPAYAPRPVVGVGIVQASSSTVSRILAGAVPSSAVPERLRLRRAIRAEIFADFDPLASGVSVVGYLPGKHPTLARDAVLVCTHLDAVGSFAGVEFADFDNFGVEVSALLEVARQFAVFSNVTRIPERTLIVGILSGGTMRSDGLSALLSQPVWDNARIHSMYYVGEPVNGRQEVASIASEAGVRASFVTSRDTIPRLVVPRSAAARASGKQARVHSSESYIPAAMVAAQDLARRLHLLAGADLMAATPISETVVNR